MEYQLTTIDELTDEQLAAWRVIQDAPEYASPFFHPEFSRAVAAARPGCEVAILSSAGTPAGFMPFFRDEANVAWSTADTLADFQGVVVAPDVQWSPTLLVHECGLAALHFDSLITTQSQFVPFYWDRWDSPFMDLSEGFEAYRQARALAGSGTVTSTLRKTRKIQREIGPLRFEARCADDGVLDQLIDWKRQQYIRTNTHDVFADAWTRQLLERLLSMPADSELRGVLSALYVGDDLIAAHVGMSCRGILHWWFPAYDVAFSKYSPGRMLLVAIAQAAEDLGLTRIDLGKGSETYKSSFASGATPVAEAVIDLRPLVGPARRVWLKTKDYVRESRLNGPARDALRRVQQLFGGGSA